MFGFVLLVAGAALAVNKICPDTCRGTADDDLEREAQWSGRTTGRAASSTAAKAPTRPTSWRVRTPSQTAGSQTRRPSKGPRAPREEERESGDASDSGVAYARTIGRNDADTLYGVGGIEALKGQDVPKSRETKRPPR